MAGLIAGLGARQVIGVDTGAVADARTTLTALLDGMPGAQFSPPELQIDRAAVWVSPAWGGRTRLLSFGV